MRHYRSHGHLNIHAHFHEQPPYHSNSRQARDAKITTLLNTVWERALAARAPRTAHPVSVAADDPAFPGLEGDE